LAFENIEKLKPEKDILITKAISWLLRNLIKYHKKEVADYLKKNKNSLPKIAVRETEKKIKTGKK
ncbi:MAG: DNA alkylation repair protein, partial [bacterium]|nr:DNA alkylation repair protein [bacterium]